MRYIATLFLASLFFVSCASAGYTRVSYPDITAVSTGSQGLLTVLRVQVSNPYLRRVVLTLSCCVTDGGCVSKRVSVSSRQDKTVVLYIATAWADSEGGELTCALKPAP